MRVRFPRVGPIKNLDLGSGSTARRGGLALADQLVASTTNFLTGVIIGRSCSQDEFGLYMLGLGFVLLAVRLQNSLISTPYMVYSPRLTKRALADYTGSTLLHQFGISLIGGSILVVAGIVISFGVGPAGLGSVIWALVFALFFILLREYARNVSFAHLDFATAFVLDVFIAAFQIGALLFLWSRETLSVSLVFWIIGAACCLPVAVWIFFRRDSFSPAVRPDRSRHQAQLEFWEVDFCERLLVGDQYLSISMGSDLLPWGIVHGNMGR